MNHVLKFVAIVAALGLIACEKPHPAQQTTDAVMTALQYGDHKTVASQHLDSSARGPYCERESVKVFERVSAVKTDESCARSRARTEVEIASLSDEERLLEQMLRYHCTAEKPTCDGFGRELLTRALKEDPALTGITRYEVKKIVGDPTQAVAYVDIVAKELVHRTLRFEKRGSSWLLIGGLTK